MPDFAVIADGSATLPPDLERELDIRRIPLHVSFPSGLSADDLSADDFYRALAGRGARFTTSQPTPWDCGQVYEAAIRDEVRETVPGVAGHLLLDPAKASHQPAD